jgi:hypothetical protein
MWCNPSRNPVLKVQGIRGGKENQSIVTSLSFYSSLPIKHLDWTNQKQLWLATKNMKLNEYIVRCLDHYF